jgi:hypothetical protein
MTNLFTIHSQDIDLREKKEMQLWLFGDVHYGNASHDEDRYKWFIEKSARCINPYYLGMGDYCDFASWSENKKIHEVVHDTTTMKLDEMVLTDNRNFTAISKQMIGRTIGLIGGNHQWKLTGGKYSDEDLAERFQTAYLGWLSVITLRLHVRTGVWVSCNIFACHGKGGGKLLGTSINQVGDMTAVINNADIYVQGHNHDRFAVPKTTLEIADTSSGVRLKQKRVFLVRSGSFQKSYQKDTSGYAQGKLMRPADLGAVMLNISVHREQRNGQDRLILDIQSVV